jgi:predicted DNA-binding transcriptional regulator AlpA
MVAMHSTVPPPPSEPTTPTGDLEALRPEREAADFLGVTTRALQKWRMRGTGPRFVRISGRCVRYRRRDLIAWAEERVKSSTAE